MLTLRRRVGNGVARIVVTEQADGDWAAPHSLDKRDVTFLRQVHGTELVRVSKPGDHFGTCADGAWTTMRGATLAVRTADCVPIALYGIRSDHFAAVAAVHAGWRGLLAGVIDNASDELRKHGFASQRAVVGPHICARHYEFGADDLRAVVSEFGSRVCGRTAWGTRSLDLSATVRVALERCGVAIDTELARCTATDVRYFSHRARAERGRTALLVSIEAPDPRTESLR